jgi:hypothetical protein
MFSLSEPVFGFWKRLESEENALHHLELDGHGAVSEGVSRGDRGVIV